MGRKQFVGLNALACALVLAFAAQYGVKAQQANTPGAAGVGIFEGHEDVGTVLHPGSVEYDATKGTYTIAGSGENMWFAADAFQFAWKKMAGDVTLTADISFIGKGVNEHRKAVLMVRQTLEANSPYADAALHGNGLTSLQFRNDQGAATHEIQAYVSAPRRLRIEKRGEYFTMWLAGADGEFHLAGGSTRIAEGTVLRGDWRMQPRQGCDGEGGVLECGVEDRGARGGCGHHSVQHARNYYRGIHGPARGLRRWGPVRSSQLDAGWQESFV